MAEEETPKKPRKGIKLRHVAVWSAAAGAFGVINGVGQSNIAIRKTIHPKGPEEVAALDLAADVRKHGQLTPDNLSERYQQHLQEETAKQDMDFAKTPHVKRAIVKGGLEGAGFAGGTFAELGLVALVGNRVRKRKKTDEKDGEPPSSTPAR